MGDELSLQSWIFEMFILDHTIEEEKLSLSKVELKFGLSLEFSVYFNKVPVRILLDVLLGMFRFSKGSFNALTSSFHDNILNFHRRLGTEKYKRLPWQFCNFTREITN